LLNAVHAKYGGLTDRFTKSKAVWKEIASEMQEEMAGITDSQCDQKWRNLKKWKKYVHGQKKTGRGKKRKPEFLYEIADILQISHTINPHVLRRWLLTRHFKGHSLLVCHQRIHQ